MILNFQSIKCIVLFTVYRHAGCLGVRVYFVCVPFVFSIKMPKHSINQIHKHFQFFFFEIDKIRKRKNLPKNYCEFRSRCSVMSYHSGIVQQICKFKIYIYCFYFVWMETKTFICYVFRYKTIFKLFALR